MLLLVQLWGQLRNSLAKFLAKHVMSSAPSAASRENSQAKQLAQGKGASAEREEAQSITQEMGFCPLTFSNTLRRQK